MARDGQDTRVDGRVGVRRRGEDEEMVVHPPSIRAAGPAELSSSDPAIPRHPERSTYRCFLPDLTGFADICRAGTESS